MKKTLLVILFAVLSAGVVSAQEPVQEPGQVTKTRKETKLKPKYFNLNYSIQNMSVSALGVNVKMFESKWGAGFSTGRTFVLHKEPIFGMLHIGIDATWFDINVASLKVADDLIEMMGGDADELGMDDAPAFYQADVAMGIGVGIHLTPISKLGIHTYARYNPTVSMLSDFASDIAGGYASGVVFGGAVSWSTISVGVEGRWNFGRYKSWVGGGEDEGGESLMIGKLNTSGCRIYLGFRW